MYRTRSLRKFIELATPNKKVEVITSGRIGRLAYTYLCTHDYVLVIYDDDPRRTEYRIFNPRERIRVLE